MYSFLLAGEDSAGFFYVNIPEFDSILPTITLQKTTLTVTANNKSKAVGSANPELTVSYSGFIDGDDESVIDTLPEIITAANNSSPAGSYDIVPYGAWDNKYEFVYVNGSLTVFTPTNLEETSEDRLTIYPNPANNYLYLQGNIPEDAKAVIFDLTGKTMFEQELTSQTIDISSLASGYYILKINDSVFNFNKE